MLEFFLPPHISFSCSSHNVLKSSEIEEAWESVKEMDFCFRVPFREWEVKKETSRFPRAYDRFRPRFLIFTLSEGAYDFDSNSVFCFSLKYEGDWVCGSRTGNGVYYYPNGDWYEGSWKSDMKDGHGVYYHKQTDTKHSGTTLAFPSQRISIA